MKMFAMALMCVLIFAGCSDSSDPVVSADENQDVMSEEVEESDAEAVVSDLDSGEEVSTLDVEQEETEQSDAAEEQFEVSEEDEPPLEEDPTSFEEDSLPDSSFFMPQIPYNT